MTSTTWVMSAFFDPGAGMKVPTPTEDYLKMLGEGWVPSGVSLQAEAPSPRHQGPMFAVFAEVWRKEAPRLDLKRFGGEVADG